MSTTSQASSKAPRIGYIGVGNMGGALARRLRLKYELHVHDLRAAAMQVLVEQGASPCASPAEVASASDIVFLCLPTSDHVRSAIFGADGVAAALRPGMLIVDQSTGDPTATRAMAEELATRGVRLIDAPVSGGIKGAEAGTIAIMVGAEPAEYERVLPVLNSISPNVFHAGGVGTGQTIKLVNNMLLAAQRLLTLEGMALAAKNGVAPETACEILKAGSGNNHFISTFLGSHVLKGKLALGFTLGLMRKDVRLACQLGSDSGVPMFYGNLTNEMYQLCIREMGAEAQVNTSALVMDRLAGTQVVPAGYTVD